MKIPQTLALLLMGLCVCSPILHAQADGSKDHSVKINTIWDTQDQASTEMMNAFRKKVASHPNLFSLVSNLDESSGLALIADCLTRNTPTDAYVCHYTSQYVRTPTKTLLGAGVYTGKSADEVADKLLADTAQDIVEPWKSTIRSNAIETLEACLFLTQSSCAVPGDLTPELHSKVINLSQYMRKGGLKK